MIQQWLLYFSGNPICYVSSISYLFWNSCISAEVFSLLTNMYFISMFRYSYESWFLSKNKRNSSKFLLIKPKSLRLQLAQFLKECKITVLNKHRQKKTGFRIRGNKLSRRGSIKSESKDFKNSVHSINRSKKTFRFTSQGRDIMS